MCSVCLHNNNLKINTGRHLPACGTMLDFKRAKWCFQEAGRSKGLSQRKRGQKAVCWRDIYNLILIRNPLPASKNPPTTFTPPPNSLCQKKAHIKAENISEIHKWNKPSAPSLLIHSPTGHLEFHCQISLGPHVWAPESYKDHIALPLHSQQYTHTHTHTEALKGGPWQNPHHPYDLRPIATYLVIQLPYRLCSDNKTSINIHPLLIFCPLHWQHLWWSSAQMDTSPDHILNWLQIVDCFEPHAELGSKGGLHDSITLPPSLCVWLLNSSRSLLVPAKIDWRGH